MAEIDQEFVEYVVKALVSNPEAVSVKRTVDDEGVLLELTVDQADVGKVIGRAGATAKSIRKLLGVLGAKQDKRVSLKIMEPDRPASEAAEPVETPAETVEQPAAEAAAPEPQDAEKDARAQLKKEVEELADLEI